jgi:hypothetical protein
MSDLDFKGNFTNFELDSDAYAAFDATSLRDLIIQRLTDQNIFTDQIFEGSNISSMIDIIAYSYHVLLFYLNRTANESMFNESQIYENMNRIVKLLNYKPIGYQTSSLTFTAKAKTNLAPEFYTIPRYSFININGTKFSTIQDITFTKSSSSEELIDSIGNENLLYQGTYMEYPVQSALGIDFEPLVMTTSTDTNIETNSINIYVKNINTGTFSEFKETESLYLETPSAKVFEKRLNENGLYEIKFGNGINGTRLNPGDKIHIYYLRSDGDKGIIPANTLTDNSMTLYSTTEFINIKNDIKISNINYMTLDNISKLEFSNKLPSTNPNEKENVAEIREYAPKFFRGQQRLITKDDFINKIKTNFGNLLTDVSVLDNSSYIDSYLKYLDKLGLTNPNLESRILLNQANFATSINFNNVYIIGVPRLEKKTTANIQSNFLSTAQKQLIKNSITKNKVIGSELVFSDPVYVAFDICAASSTEKLTEDLSSKSQLIIEPTDKTQANIQSIKQAVSTAITNYFLNKNCKLGQLVDLNELSNTILSIPNVKTFYTTRSDNPNLRIEGLGLLTWNPVYSTSDMQLINQNIQLDSFKFPYWFDTASLIDKIII